MYSTLRFTAITLIISLLSPSLSLAQGVRSPEIGAGTYEAGGTTQSETYTGETDTAEPTAEPEKSESTEEGKMTGEEKEKCDITEGVRPVIYKNDTENCKKLKRAYQDEIIEPPEKYEHMVRDGDLSEVLSEFTQPEQNVEQAAESSNNSYAEGSLPALLKSEGQRLESTLGELADQQTQNLQTRDELQSIPDQSAMQPEIIASDEKIATTQQEQEHTGVLLQSVENLAQAQAELETNRYNISPSNYTLAEGQIRDALTYIQNSDVSSANSDAAVAAKSASVKTSWAVSAVNRALGKADVNLVRSENPRLAEVSPEVIGNSYGYGKTYSGPKGTTALNNAARNAARIYAGFDVPPVDFTEEELDRATRIALAESSIIVNESGLPDTEALKSVMDVMRNRVLSDSFPDTLDGVLFQKNAFSPVGNKSYLKDEYGPSSSNYTAARNMMEAVLKGEAVPIAVTAEKDAMVNFGNLATINSSQSQASKGTKANFNNMTKGYTITFKSAAKPNTFQHTFGTIGSADTPSFAPDPSEVAVVYGGSQTTPASSKPILSLNEATTRLATEKNQYVASELEFTNALSRSTGPTLAQAQALDTNRVSILARDSAVQEAGSSVRRAMPAYNAAEQEFTNSLSRIDGPSTAQAESLDSARASIDRAQVFADKAIIAAAQHEPVEAVAAKAQARKEAFDATVEASYAFYGETVNIATVVDNEKGLAFPMYGQVGGHGANSPMLGYERGRLHAGVDIYAPAGTPLAGEHNQVFAPADGKIVKVGKNYPGYGYYLDIESEVDGKKVYFRMAHIEPQDWKVGDSVTKGEVLSYVSGDGTEFQRTADSKFGGDLTKTEAYFNENGWGAVAKPHLHFETRSQPNSFRGDHVIDPDTYYPEMQLVSGQKYSDTFGSTEVTTASVAKPEFSYTPIEEASIKAAAMSDSNTYKADTVRYVADAITKDAQLQEIANTFPQGLSDPGIGQTTQTRIATLQAGIERSLLAANESAQKETRYAEAKSTKTSPVTITKKSLETAARRALTISPVTQPWSNFASPFAGGNTNTGPAPSTPSANSPVAPFLGTGSNDTLSGSAGTDDLSVSKATEDSDKSTLRNADTQGQSWTDRLDGLADSAEDWLGFDIPFVGSNGTEPDELTDSLTSSPAEEADDLALVHLTVNDQDNSLTFSREDLLNAVDADPVNNSAVAQLLTQPQPAITFNETGQVTYSNGLYAPVTNGYAHTDPTQDPEYIYLVTHIDETGQVVSNDNSETLPKAGPIASFIQSLYPAQGLYAFEDVESVSCTLVDPSTATPRDEYCEYTITLSNGSTRQTTIPEETNVALMQERFSETGYRGDVIKLFYAADIIDTEDQQERKGLARGAIDAISSSFTKLVGLLKSGPEESNDSTSFADLNTNTKAGRDLVLKQDDIFAIYIYPEAAVPCPDIPGLDDGYVYDAFVRDSSTSGQMTVITQDRCGIGTDIELAAAVAAHLESTYGFSNLRTEQFLEKTFIDYTPITYTPGLTIIDSNKAADIQSLQEDIGRPTSDNDSRTSLYVANTSNTISFERKIKDEDGVLVADWSSGNVTIDDSMMIDLRWDASDYTQCLVFFNDSGAYSLTRFADKQLLTGNTEQEGYRLKTADLTYRIECGGQNNGEFGVDSREIHVTVTN